MEWCSGKLERSLLTTSNSREAEPKVRRLESNFCTIKFLSQVLHSVAITTKLTEARLSVSFFSFTTPSYLIRQNIPNFHTSSAIFNSILQPTDLKPQMSESWVRKPFLTHTEKGRFNTWKYLVAGGFGQHWWVFLLCLLVLICFYILLSPAFLHCFMSSFSPFIPCLFIRILPFSFCFLCQPCPLWQLKLLFTVHMEMGFSTRKSMLTEKSKHKGKWDC